MYFFTYNSDGVSMSKVSILILDSDISIQNYLKIFFCKQKFCIYQALTPAKGFKILNKEKIDIVILDITLPDRNGLEILKEIKRKYKSLEVILIAGFEDPQLIINATMYGIFDYFFKPLNINDIENSIKQIFRHIESQNILKSSRNIYFDYKNEEHFDTEQVIIGKSRKIRKVLDLTLKAARADETSILITGPSGCGKEVIAKAIHRLSSRKNHCFYSINCAAIPEQLAESEFFGHKKGAFTGAFEDKKGCFQEASDGILFIDEIGDLSLSIQAKLLRVLESKRIRRIGDSKESLINTRIICATNQNLLELVEKNKFRLDLYYRLNTFEIKLPSLKERTEDIPLLLEYYIKFYSRKFDKQLFSINTEVFDFLNTYDFPGNIRELRNLAEKAVILCDSGIIKLNHFPVREIISRKLFKKRDIQKKKRHDRKRVVYFKENTTRTIGKKEIVTAMKLSKKENISTAAKILGISRQSLYRKLKKYRIEG